MTKVELQNYETIKERSILQVGQKRSKDKKL